MRALAGFCALFLGRAGKVHIVGIGIGRGEPRLPFPPALYRAATCRPGMPGSRGGSRLSWRVWASTALAPR